MFYLYLKTHRQSGLKYLGFTAKKDPYKYRGSGKVWLKHLKKYGNDIDTQILLATADKEEAAATGIFFSKLWNVVQSSEWANLIEETTAGPSAEDARARNTKLVEDGTHQWLGHNNPSHKMVKNGTHHLLGERNHVHQKVKDGSHHFCSKEKQLEMAAKKVKAGTHNFFMVSCIDRAGNHIMIPKEQYRAQTGPKNTWEYLHISSKELVERGFKSNKLGKKRGPYKK